MLAPPLTRPEQRNRLAAGLGAILLAPLLFLLLVPRLEDHPRTSLTITNPTNIDLTVEVSETTTGATTPLANVPARGRVTVDEVWDEGATWVLGFSGQGERLGRVTYPRAVLDATDWTIAVPETVVQQIDDLGLPPSPR